MTLNTSVENYFIDGCGRCPLWKTPQCKVHTWVKELGQLRKIILDCGLTEEAKWGVPCYTYKNKNILILSAFKEYCSISFFKGVLLSDLKSLLEKPGENSQSSRLLKFINVKQVLSKEADIKAYIFEAIEVEKAGLKVDFKKSSDLDIPEELQKKMDVDPLLKSAFNSLTPGRKRGYVLFIEAAKQPQTRMARIEKYRDKILSGLGMNDR